MADNVTAPARPDRAQGDRTSERDLTVELIALGKGSGMAAVGVARVGTFADVRHDLFERKRKGLHAGMQFTYRNPDRSTDPGRVLPGARSLVVGAWGYDRGQPAGAIARYAQHDHYGDLRRSLQRLADRLGEQGWRARVVCDDNALVDRAAAHRAGLGWFGKNTLLLLPGLGSWFVLGSVVTDAPLATTVEDDDAPMAHGSGCGRCTRCADACPTGALDTPGVLDARRCLAWLLQAPGSFPLEFRDALGGRIYGCDACQQACPINAVASRRHPPPPADPGSAPDVDLPALLAMGDEELLHCYGRFYLPGRQPRFLRRNALVALGNVGDGSDPATVAALERALVDADPLLVEHAAWAARRLGRDDLVARLAPRAPAEQIP